MPKNIGLILIWFSLSLTWYASYPGTKLYPRWLNECSTFCSCNFNIFSSFWKVISKALSKVAPERSMWRLKKAQDIFHLHEAIWWQDLKTNAHYDMQDTRTVWKWHVGWARETRFSLCASHFSHKTRKKQSEMVLQLEFLVPYILFVFLYKTGDNYSDLIFETSHVVWPN